METRPHCLLGFNCVRGRVRCPMQHTLIHEISARVSISRIHFPHTWVSCTHNFRAHHSEGKQYKTLHMQLFLYLSHLSLRSMIRYYKLLTKHKMSNGQCPGKLKNRFTCRFQVSNYQTRNSDKLQIVVPRLGSRKRDSTLSRVYTMRFVV